MNLAGWFVHTDDLILPVDAWRAVGHVPSSDREEQEMPTGRGLTSNIADDLKEKVVDDVGGALSLHLAAADSSAHMPIALAAGGVCVGLTAALLWEDAGAVQPPAEPDPESMLLAALLLARHGQGCADAMGEAQKDFEALKAARRLSASAAGNRPSTPKKKAR
jgi:hypothetical protein